MEKYMKAAFKYDVEEIIEINSTNIVRFNYPQVKFNVEAYDVDGNKLWNINDIIGLDPATTQSESESFVKIKKSEENDHYIYAWSFGGIRYCIDVEKKELVEVLFVK